MTRPRANDTPVSTYRVQASRLEGEVHVSGAKNSVLRLLAASLLTGEQLQISNYPATLLDAQIHLDMLRALGKRCEVSGDTVIIDEASKPPSELVWPGRSIRNTLLILGALTARTGSGSVPLPGGCKLGDRKHDLHVMLLEALGAEVTETDTHLQAHAPNGLKGADIHLPIRSTGATENAIMCGTLARGVTTVWNPHIRPEILDLIAMLRSMGATINVFGQERIEIRGSEGLFGTRHRVIADNMEALTWLVGACLTKGDVEIHGFPIVDLEVPLIHLKESGACFFTGPKSVIVRGGTCYPVEISTGAYPGINSDMQPLFAVFGAMSRGESKIIDLRFPGRYLYAEEMALMGVDTRVEGNLLRIKGGNQLRGAEVTARDLRAGIALTLAGLVAEGETVIRDAWQVERGYDRFIDKMQALGGQVTPGW
ncbi:UDP-N-acetylglucosamine 1-carboxyvinyltransferase [Ideonella azotifigens]|uniref:UDP-N-acetylglucosamine 1-carboxyvinyltransferase n=1 Tax=Ideonella azotifigens TaxID=513160 RepID=A0ABP3UWA5_9BURK|nr:UDP-N-acetylglucosamine 1-carboxyvinyltransferase [Ideonella azotifigens]MCD2342056.1 UDP-N-acetylglucosamine 1-carboxyvinyltransferase [Ideonella azotifigens]